MTIKLTSLGLTGPEWIKRLEKKGYELSSYAKEILNSSDFKAAKKGTKYEIAIIKYSDIGKTYPTTKEVQEYALSKGYEPPNTEVACLLREKLTDKDIEALGVSWVTTFHTPIEVGGSPRFLSAVRDVDGSWLSTCWANPGLRWSDGGAFAWALSQVGSKTLKPLSLPSVPLALRLSSQEDIDTAISFLKKAGYQVSKIM